MALIIEFCDHNIPFLKVVINKDLCKESLINDENWKNAYTKGYVVNLFIGGARPPLLKYWGGQWPPWPPLFLLH